MKTPKEIKTEIAKIHRDYAHVLGGSRASVLVNAPRAAMQISAEARLTALHWVLGTTYKSKLKGLDI